MVLILHIRDLDTINYIYNILQIGKITISKSKVTYIIEKSSLQDILFPLLEYHKIYFFNWNKN